MIVATAGHVDHGKTSLVLTLTGVDTDRLPEEKRRGMSIELGFAYADLGGPALLGFVDVPGHERFVRQMLAGVASVDLALLVVAADDGPMPQTREHLAILELLGVPDCVVALTKIDRVAPARVTQVAHEVQALLAAGPFRQAPLFPLVATGGEGVSALRDHLAEAGRALAARRPAGRFRMVVDRSFRLAGAGRVVAGAVLAGSVRAGDTVVVSPAGSVARVRSLHTNNREAESARAGQRCALNLTGGDLKRAEPARGDWVVAPAAHAPTGRLDVRLQVLAGEARPLADRSALQLHIGAATCMARLAVIEGRAIAPGTAGLAQLVLDAPVAALHGDRLILRDPSAQRTIAGGFVIDPFGAARGRSRPARIAQLAALSLPAPQQALAALLDAMPQGVDLARFTLARNLADDEAAQLLGCVPHRRIERAGGPLALAPAAWLALRDRIGAALAAWHAEQPDSLGAGEAALAERLGLRNEAALLRAALASLVDDGTVVREGLRLRLGGHRAVLPAADAELLERVAALLKPAGLRPPIVGELATLLDMPLPALLEFLQRAVRTGALVRVAPNRFYLPQTIPELLCVAHELAVESGNGAFDAAAYRDRSGIGRNLTVQVLEFMDREHLTRFDGARRRMIV